MQFEFILFVVVAIKGFLLMQDSRFMGLFCNEKFGHFWDALKSVLD